LDGRDREKTWPDNDHESYTQTEVLWVPVGPVQMLMLNFWVLIAVENSNIKIVHGN
jgi:hypothetical protein